MRAVQRVYIIRMLLGARTFLVPLMSSLLNWGSISPTKEQTALVNGIICIGLGLASMSEAAGTGQLGIGCWDVDPPSQLQLAERGSGRGALRARISVHSMPCVWGQQFVA